MASFGDSCVPANVIKGAYGAQGGERAGKSFRRQDLHQLRYLQMGECRAPRIRNSRYTCHDAGGRYGLHSAELVLIF